MTDTPEPSEDETVVRPFAAWLQEQQKGSTHAELSELFHELIGLVKDTGKPGELMLKIKVTKAKGDRNAINIADAVAVKRPVAEKEPSLFFIDRAGNPTRNNPEQFELPGLRQVPNNGGRDQTADRSAHA